MGGWWEGDRKDKQQEQEVKDQGETQQEQIQEEEKESASRREDAVERLHLPWGQAVDVRPHPRTTRRASAAATTHPVSTQPHPSTSTTFWTSTTSVGHVPTIATSYSGTGARPKTTSPFWRPPPLTPPRHRRRLSPPPGLRRQRAYRRTRFVLTHVEYSIEMITLNISLQDLLKNFEEVSMMCEA